MRLIVKIEAAMRLGISISLLEYFVAKSPKNDGRKLKEKVVDGESYFDESELNSFQLYLRAPWPPGKDGARPHIPKAIKDDIKEESHLSCAICGHMDDGEVAHIDPVPETLNNSPDNLIFLCPNHHEHFDSGFFKPSSNVSMDAILAAKTVKRDARRRIMRMEANATQRLTATIATIKAFDERLKKGISDPNESSAYVSESRRLLESLPELTKEAVKEGRKDKDASDTANLIAKIAPRISKFAGGSLRRDVDVRNAATHAINIVDTALIELDEEACPHCGGRGTTGLAGHFCIFCKGSCFVSRKRLGEYNPNDVDEVACPHCDGHGQTGLVGTLCVYCHGACTVSKEDKADYNPEEIDETECPHCAGSGQKGLAGFLCSFCKGERVVTTEKARTYKSEEIDEVDCPHCEGSGRKGLLGDSCAFCKGACVLSSAKAGQYDPSRIDEVNCPRCDGAGQTGMARVYCSFCNGSCVMTKAKAATYEPEAIDEIECPRCNGSGITGLVGDSCKLCKGSQVVSRATDAAYRKKYGSRGD